MPKTTHPIAYAYTVDGAHVIITRVHIRTAYARNGNVGNPTEYFRWEWAVESGPRGTGSSRSDAYELARAAVLGIRYVNNDTRKMWVNVRPWTVVKDEMQANYTGRTVVNDDKRRSSSLDGRPMCPKCWGTLCVCN